MIGTYSPTITIKYSMNIYPIWTDSTLEIGAAPEGLSDTMFPAGAKAIRYCVNKAG